MAQNTSLRDISVKTIAAMIARNHKHLEFDIYDIVEWTAEVVKNTGVYESFVQFKDIEISISDKKALLPCGVFRLLNIYFNGCKVNPGAYYADDAFIHLHQEQTGSLKIDYIGIKTDDDGFPMILDTMKDAVYWYCLTKLYFEDFISGRMDQGRYAYMENKYAIAADKAKGSFRYFSRNDMDHAAAILYNMLPKIRMPKNLD